MGAQRMTYDEAYKLAKANGARIKYSPKDEREVNDVIEWAEAFAAKGTMSDEEWLDRYGDVMGRNYAGPAYSKDIVGTTPLPDNKIRYHYKDGTSEDFEQQNDWGDRYGELIGNAVQAGMTIAVPPMGVALGATNAIQGGIQGDWKKAAGGALQAGLSGLRIPGSEFADLPSGASSYLGDMYTGMDWGGGGADLAGLGGLTEAGALEGAQLGAGSTYGAIETAATAAVEQAATNAGVTLTEAAKDAAKKAVTDAAVAKAGAWGAKEILQAATLAITAATTIGGMVSGGDKTTSATTTTQNTGPGTNPFPTGVTPSGTDTTGKTAGAVTFDDFINDFYGLKGGKSAQSRGVEDQTALTGYQQTLLDTLKNLDTTRLTDTRAAVSPYLDQLSGIQDQLTNNKGLGKQVAFGFGGQPMASFVPRPNRDLANQLLGMGRESSQINTGLVDMGYKAGTDQASRQFGFNSENLPNKAADTYTAKLMELMKYFNPTGQTSTTTGTVPGTPWYTTAMQGLTTGVNIWDKINNPRQSNGMSAADLANLKTALGLT